MRYFPLFVLFLASCLPPREHAEVAVPGTNLTLFFELDEKDMTYYHFVVDGSRASEMGFLGPHVGEHGLPVEVSENQDLVRFTWGGQFVVLDTRACRVVEHSNFSRSPPALEGCISNRVPAA